MKGFQAMRRGGARERARQRGGKGGENVPGIVKTKTTVAYI